MKRLEHVGIMVKDLDLSIQFYQKAFGLVLRRRQFLNETVELAFLHFPEQADMEIELVAGRNMDEVEGLVNHLAFRVDNISEEIERLTKMGVEMVDTESRLILGDVKIAFFKGPNGEKLELVER
ncbi:VOC family protein [Ammoniphilus resinae]|uniref:Lactoylglutathione lyase n=1 Tax=Ammoniphilus resinae TaxID=861532 RepID=A0ABS4GNM1_9BACL|nr:VOC family protein [Ammoniphilus resinae]MBP1931657.1 lactoylglutathione lyase [Ammoniphilus resinae]